MLLKTVNEVQKQLLYEEKKLYELNDQKKVTAICPKYKWIIEKVLYYLSEKLDVCVSSKILKTAITVCKL